MKKCSDCNVDMIEGAKIEGQQHFEIGPDGHFRIYLTIPTGKKILGFEKTVHTEPQVRICPECGKVELYIVPNKR